MNEKELQEEIEELSLHLADMLEVALLYAGAKKEKIEKIAKLYVDSIDEALKDDDSEEMDREDIITVIEYIKSKNRDLFN
jgi:hypothetical protein